MPSASRLSRTRGVRSYSPVADRVAGALRLVHPRRQPGGRHLARVRPRGVEDRPAGPLDRPRVDPVERAEVVAGRPGRRPEVGQPFPSPADAEGRVARLRGAVDDALDDGVEAGHVAAAGEDRDPFWFGHAGAMLPLRPGGRSVAVGDHSGRRALRRLLASPHELRALHGRGAGRGAVGAGAWRTTQRGRRRRRRGDGRPGPRSGPGDERSDRPCRHRRAPRDGPKARCRPPGRRDDLRDPGALRDVRRRAARERCRGASSSPLANTHDGAAGSVIQLAQHPALPRRIKVVSGIRRDEAEALFAPLAAR